MRRITPLWRRIAAFLPEVEKGRIHRTKRRSSSGNTAAPALAIVGATLGYGCCILASADAVSDGGCYLERPSRNAYKYLICGGGIAAQEALNVFLEENQTDDLLVVSPEWSEYDTDPGRLTEPVTEEACPDMWSQLLQGLTAVLPSSVVGNESKNRADIVIGSRVTNLDSSQRIATLEDGTKVSFERCLIATGRKMPTIPIGKVVSRDAADLVSGAQSQSDWRQIDNVLHDCAAVTADANASGRAHVTVVGGGWLSTIVGATLVERGADVTFSYSEPAFLARYLPKYVASDLLTRLVWRSGGGVDSLSYAAVKYVVARRPYESSARSIEAEVHVGTVFDAFSIIDFRTDHVIFAPTLLTHCALDAPSLLEDKGGFVANAELAVASDIYVAGSALCVDKGALHQPPVSRWSANHAKASGRHAALNMLGAREAYSFVPTFTVDLPSICIRLHVLGNVDGLAESFGYFLRSKSRDHETSGGQFEIGAVFCVTPAPLSHRGAAQKLQVSGVTLWEGSSRKQIQDIEAAKQAANDLLKRDAMSRPELESALDTFSSEYLGIVLSDDAPTLESEPLEAGEVTNVHAVEERTPEGNDEILLLKPLQDVRRSSPRVVWRRHTAVRSSRVLPDELLWVEDERIGAVSPETPTDRASQAYTDLLKKSAGMR